jgi:hypothetical protein
MLVVADVVVAAFSVTGAPAATAIVSGSTRARRVGFDTSAATLAATSEAFRFAEAKFVNVSRAAPRLPVPPPPPPIRVVDAVELRCIRRYRCVPSYVLLVVTPSPKRVDVAAPVGAY